MKIGREWMPSIIEWVFNPMYRGSPTGQLVQRSVIEPAHIVIEPSLAFIEYTGVPAMLGGSVIPVASQVAFQGGQARYITQPAAAAAGKPLTFKNAFALEFIAGTMLMALALTIVDPKDYRTGGLAETTWYGNNITNGGLWAFSSSFNSVLNLSIVS